MPNGELGYVFFRIFRVPDAIRAIENVTPLMPRMARARHT